MIVISAGMQRSASGSYFNLTNDLLTANGNRDVRELRRKYVFKFFSTEANVNVGPLRAYKLLWLLLPHLAGQTFAVKTHEAPSLGARLLLRWGPAKATYIYRDPRDVAVSLYEYGRRMREANIPTSTQFDKLETMEQAIQFVSRLIPIWRAWTELGSVHVVRYEEFTRDVYAEAARLAPFLELDLTEADALRLARQYDRRHFEEDQTPEHSHFETGRVGRWRALMSEDQKELCRRLLSGALEEMGYEGRW